MSDITVINDSQQSELVTNGLAKNGELYLKAAGSTDEGAIVVYDSGSWRTFANEASSGFANTYSVAFDGTNDYMETGVPIVTGTSSISMSGWVYLTSAPGNYDQAFAIRGASGSAAYRTARMLGFLGGRLHFNTFASQAIGSATLSLNTWHHIAATCTSSGDVRLYVNGVCDALGSVGYDPVASGNTFVIALGGISEYLAAKIDEAAVWDSVLSDGGVSAGQTAGGDIATLYNSGVPNDISSLSPLGWWRMGDNDGGTGTTITDQGSGGNDGTLTNGPTFSTDVPS